MPWTKHFQPVNTSQSRSLQGQQRGETATHATGYQSTLPLIYAGPPERIQRYDEYDFMDYDAQIHSSLDTIADFCTQQDDQHDLPFKIRSNQETLDQEEMSILTRTLTQWVNLNNLNVDIWDIVRDTLRFGDQFYIRDPETMVWEWVNPRNVDNVIVDETKAKEIVAYKIRGLDLNLMSRVATDPTNKSSTVPSMYNNLGHGSMLSGPSSVSNNQSNLPSAQPAGGRTGLGPNSMEANSSGVPVDANCVIHFSLGNGKDGKWPFGTSYLENVYKTYKQKCCDINELVPLLDGRTITLSQIIKEFEEGKQNWVYSADPITGKVAPGKVSWAGITRRQTQCIRLTLDNGKTLTVTPDHEIPVLGYGKMQAQNLTTEMSLIAFNRRKKDLGNSDREYEQVWDHEDKKWVYTHRMVAEYMRDKNVHTTWIFDEATTDKPKTLVHHIDFNRFNNTPENLAWMDKQDHFDYHSAHRKEFWENITEEEKNSIIQKHKDTWNAKSEDEMTEFSDKLKSAWELSPTRREDFREFKTQYWENLDEEERTTLIKKSYGPLRAYRDNMTVEDKKDERTKAGKTTSITRQKIKKENPELHYSYSEKNRFSFTQEMLSIVVNTVKLYGSRKNTIIKILEYDQTLLKLLENANSNKSKHLKLESFTGSKLLKLIRSFGYINWNNFIENIENYNHKIVKIEWLDEKLDTGDLTVDQDELLHNYHTFAIDSGIFVGNSMLEDSMLIYRVQRAPERRVYYIDVGDLPPSKADAALQRTVNKIQQKRIPNRNAGGMSIMDTTYNPLCMALDTVIPLLDGRTCTLQQLIIEFENGKENWVYSCDPRTGAIVPGNISWAGITKKNADVIRLVFNNKEELIVTNEHKIPVLHKGFVKAKDLTADDILISFNKTNNTVWSHEHKKWASIPKLVGEWFKAQTKHTEYTYDMVNYKNDKTVVVNKNGDTNNSDPRNIVWMSKQDIKLFRPKSLFQKLKDSFKKVISHFRDEPEQIRIENIEYLNQRYDVGTLTIDQDEKFHLYHTFAINSGIFVKNSMLEDFYFAQSSSGRGSRVEVLPGGTGLANLDDLYHFNAELKRGLGVPSSYLPSGPEDGGVPYNDGKMGTAIVQEFRFNKMCTRIQRKIMKVIDNEFKIYLKKRGFNINSGSFSIEFHPPQNFTKYRQMELDSQAIQAMTQLFQFKFLPKRWVLQRYGQLTEEDLHDLEVQWIKENPDLVKQHSIDQQEPEAGVESMGVGGGFSGGGDFDDNESFDMENDQDIDGEAPEGEDNEEPEEDDETAEGGGNELNS